MQPVRPIPVNPGGQLDVEHIVGREEVCREVAATLKTRSVVITGERRMGKTSLSRLVKVQAEKEGWTVVAHSAEGYGSLDALAEALTVKFEALTGPLAGAARLIRERTTMRLGPVEVAPANRTPRFEDVVAAAVEAADGRLLLILDEVPLFARSLDDQDGQARAGTAALHLLRHLRETHHGMRMLCLGSVGFHHVIRDASGVLNDTEPLRLHPLARTDACYLARCLLRGIDVQVDGEPTVAEAIAQEVEGVPYYIHKVVESIEKRDRREALDPSGVAEIVTNAVSGAADDPWNLRHYRDRIPLYYRDEAALARATLDAVAAVDGGADFGAIHRRVKGRPGHESVDGDQLHDILERLEDDHYLSRDGSNRRFAFALVQRAWTELRR